MKQPVFPIIFLGSDHISLQAMNQLIKNSKLEVRGVITLPARSKGRGLRSFPSPVAQRAEELSLPVLTPDNLKSSEFLSQVNSLEASWAVLFSYGKILSRSFLSLFPERALNFHPSLLPRWRGAAPIQRAIMAGERELGMSLQVMKPQLDAGPLIGTRSFTIEPQMDATDAFRKIEFLIQDLLSDMVEYMKGHLIPRPQDESQATYAPKIDKRESRIIWTHSALKIFNQIRALSVGPQAYTFYRRKRIKIYKAHCFPKEDLGGAPGQIMEMDSDYLKVACGDSTLSVLQLQPESRKIMSAKDYIRGFLRKAGSKKNIMDQERTNRKSNIVDKTFFFD